MASLADYPADRHAIVSALDALEVGDARLACEILLAALEDGEYVVRARCRVCGAGFPWAGLRDHHELMVHEPDPNGLPVAGTAPEPEPEHHEEAHLAA